MGRLLLCLFEGKINSNKYYSSLPPTNWMLLYEAVTAIVVVGLDEYLLIIIHQSMLHELLSNLIGLLLLYYDFILH